MKKIVLLIGVLTTVFILSGCEDTTKTCDEGYELRNGACYEAQVCNEGFELVDGECVDTTPTCEAGFAYNTDSELCELDPDYCPEGQELEEGECVDIPLSCLPGYSEVDGECVEDQPTCIPGYEVVNGVCQEIVCQDGYILVDNECIEQIDSECLPGYELVNGVCAELDHPEYNDMGYDLYEGRDIVTEQCSHLDNIGEWQPVWCDEFDYQGLPDSTLWYFETGGHGWGNGESQYYTSNDPDNAFVKDGNLTITAIKESYNGNDYTSVRLNSKSGNWTYGKIQVRAILPGGRGTWPAVWMLPTDWEYGGWPDSGEIDIMEYVGYDPNRIHATVHTLAYHHSIGTQVGKSKIVANPEELYHVYEIEWEPGIIKAYVDGILYFTYDFDPEDNVGIENFKAWPFDKDFHLLLNIAIGGAWGGAQGIDDTIFPQSMVIDYVRVYQKDYAGMDETAPEAVTNLAALDVGQSDVYLGWDIAVDDVMIEKYEIYIDDTLYTEATINGYLVKGLTPGTEYNIKVKAIDFAGNESGFSEITVTTDLPQTQNDRVEAEDFTLNNGIGFENTSDTGGGQNAGWTDSGDYLEYVVNITEAGTYTVTYRIAGDGSAPGLDFMVDGSLLVNTSIPATGGWQSWTDVTTAQFTLTEGIHTIRLYVVAGGFNLNYFEFNKVN